MPRSGPWLETWPKPCTALPGSAWLRLRSGFGQRLVVLDCARKEDPPNLITAINPEIVSREGSVNEEEGCLSVPEYYARVTRSARVRVRFLDLEGQTVELDAEDLLAIAFQHEIDHLDGILFIDHLSPLKKGIFRKKYQKLLDQRQEQL